MPSPPVPTTLTNALRRLGLPRTADDLNDRIARATRLRWSPTVLLEHLVTTELEERRRRSIERRLSCSRAAQIVTSAVEAISAARHIRERCQDK